MRREIAALVDDPLGCQAVLARHVDASDRAWLPISTGRQTRRLTGVRRSLRSR